MKIGVRVFIQGVSSDALRCTSKSRPEGTDDEVVATDSTKDNPFAHSLGSHRPAFRDFSCMPREPSRKAAQDWKGSVQGRIAAASGKDEVSASFQSALQWLDTHHADDPGAPVNYRLVDVRGRLKGTDPIFSQ